MSEERPGFYWKVTVTRGGCVMCRHEPVDREIARGRNLDLKIIEGHHVIKQQYLKREHLEDLLWDARNGIGLCRYHHGRHESAMQRVPAALIPDEAWEFAEEIGMIWVIEREYA